jgi:hypothetical protein
LLGDIMNLKGSGRLQADRFSPKLPKTVPGSDG